MMCFLLSTDVDEADRQRKGEGAIEKPAKQKLVGNRADHLEPADATASAIENLALKKSPGEPQQGHPDTENEGKQSGNLSCSGTSSSNSSLKETTNKSPPEGKLTCRQNLHRVL